MLKSASFPTIVIWLTSFPLAVVSTAESESSPLQHRTMAAVNQAINRCRCQVFTAEYPRSLGKGQIRNNSHASPITAVAQNLEEQLSLRINRL